MPVSLRKWRKRGTILIGVLLLILVLRMLVVGLMLRLHASGSANQGNQDDNQALLACQSGVAEAMARLSKGGTWTPPQLPSRSPDGNSSYQVQLVNNLNGTVPASGIDGRPPVPPGSAYVVSTGTSGSRTRTVEAVLGYVLDNQNYPTAMQAGGAIHILGQADISGQAAANDPSPQKIEVISTSTATSPGLVQLTSGRVDGSIKVSGPSAGAVNVGSATVTGGVKSSVPARALPPIDIPGQISARAGLSAPTLTPGSTVITGDHYMNGDLHYDGNLTLNGSNLFVKGKVEVTGTLSGRGSLIVGQTTSIHGNAQLKSSSGLGLAIVSQGSINLRGFDGTGYLTNLAANAPPDENGIPYSKHLDNLLAGISQQRQDLADHMAGQDPTNAKFGVDESDYDHIGFSLAHGYNSYLPQTSTLPFTSDPKQDNPIARLTGLVVQQPASATRDFVLGKLKSMYDEVDGKETGFYGVVGQTQGRDTILTTALSTGNLDGISDVVNDGGTNPFSNYGNTNWSSYTPAQINAAYNLLKVTVDNLSLDGVGAARFDGVLLTRGHIYSSGGIQIIGSALASDDGSQGPETVDGYRLAPGDIQLNEGTVIRYVPGLENLIAQALGRVGVVSWSAH